MSLLIFLIGIILILYFMVLAVGLLKILDELCDYAISNFLEEWLNSTLKIIKTILHKK